MALTAETFAWVFGLLFVLAAAVAIAMGIGYARAKSECDAKKHSVFLSADKYSLEQMTAVVRGQNPTVKPLEVTLFHLVDTADNLSSLPDGTYWVRNAGLPDDCGTDIEKPSLVDVKRGAAACAKGDVPTGSAFAFLSAVMVPPPPPKEYYVTVAKGAAVDAAAAGLNLMLATLEDAQTRTLYNVPSDSKTYWVRATDACPSGNGVSKAVLNGAAVSCSADETVTDLQLLVKVAGKPPAPENVVMSSAPKEVSATDAAANPALATIFQAQTLELRGVADGSYWVRDCSAGEVGTATVSGGMAVCAAQGALPAKQAYLFTAPATAKARLLTRQMPQQTFAAASFPSAARLVHAGAVQGEDERWEAQQVEEQEEAYRQSFEQRNMPDRQFRAGLAPRPEVWGDHPVRIE